MVNSLDPGPCCSNWDWPVWDEDEGNSPPPPLHSWSMFSVGAQRALEASQGRMASLHSGDAAEGSGRRQNGHVVFWIIVPTYPPAHFWLYIHFIFYFVLYILFLQGK